MVLGTVVSLAHYLKYFSAMAFVWGGRLSVICFCPSVCSLPIPPPVGPSDHLCTPAVLRHDAGSESGDLALPLPVFTES